MQVRRLAESHGTGDLSAVPHGSRTLLPSCGGPLTRRAMLARSVGAAAVIAAGHCLKALAADAEDAKPAIWDAHVHLTNATGTVEERVDWLLAHADRMGIERLTICMGTSFVEDPSPDELRQANDAVLRAIDHNPRRIMGLVYLSPKHTDASLREMDRCIRNGPMLGVKLWVATRCSRPELDPLVRRAVELKIPILQHTFWHVDGNGPGESTPADMTALAARHPDASFIAAHAGADWERGIREIRAAKNVVVDVCGSDPTSGFVEMAVRELGPERVLYGSDAGGRSFASQLAKVTTRRAARAGPATDPGRQPAASAPTDIIAERGRPTLRACKTIT